MTATLVVGFALACPNVGAWFVLVPWCEPCQPLPRLPDQEALHRGRLDSARRARDFWKAEIAWTERLVAKLQAARSGNKPGSLPKETQTRLVELIAGWQRDIQEYRGDFQRWERWVQELEGYELARKFNPGAATEDEWEKRLATLKHELWGPHIAPMPREVKK